MTDQAEATLREPSAKERWRLQRWCRIATACLAVAFASLVLVNAWVVDESYITFRTADNVLNGYGLTWNTGERVQAYTHPMWMFVMMPRGYERTVIEPGVHLADPSLRHYYKIVVSITQGPLFTRERFKHILGMNLGRYDYLLDEYAARQPS